jgi:hypothetical protein
MNIMKLLSCGAVCLVLLSLSGCCGWMKEFNEPEKPTNPKGWQVHQDRSITVRGDFVLARGESVDDGNIGIKVLEISGGYCGFGHEPVYPETKLQFFHVSNHTVICEDEFRVGASRLDTIEACGGQLKWGFLGVSGINAKDNWVAFTLN